ncbi:MAG: hypothetical protein AAF989_16230 [Planctomycetota bacterium]
MSTKSETDQWKTLQKRVRKQAVLQSAKKVFGSSAKRGRVFRWGVTTATRSPIPDLAAGLSRLACEQKLSERERENLDLPLAAEIFCDETIDRISDPVDAIAAITWGAAMPALIGILPTRVWWDLLGKLQHVCEQHRGWDHPESPVRLMLGGELGLTLAWRLKPLPSCQRLLAPSIRVIDDWFKEEADCISASVTKVRFARLTLASILRCERLLPNLGAKGLGKRQRAIASDLATWVAGFTNPGGGNVFDVRDHSDGDELNRDDAPSGKSQDDSSLLIRATNFDAESLRPAMDAALGKSQTGGRLAWMVSLPESLIHCDVAKVGVMMSDWDVRRGRVAVDYGNEECQLEVYAGRDRFIAGSWQVMLTINGEEQIAQGDWESTCEFSDDDVHYLEFEQPWSGGLVLQRQILQIRDERCVMLADAVLPDPNLESPGPHLQDPKAIPQEIRYTSRLPLDPTLVPHPEAETREIYFCKRPKFVPETPLRSAKVMAIPLSANEWRVGPTGSELHVTDESCLVCTSKATNHLYSPIWFDFSPRRFKRKRTWRPLTIADELRVVEPDEATAYRLQMGSEHWMLYRSLGAQRCRSVLGKHLIADFFAGRFHPGDGGLEELVTVEGQHDE